MYTTIVISYYRPGEALAFTAFAGSEASTPSVSLYIGTSIGGTQHCPPSVIQFDPPAGGHYGFDFDQDGDTDALPAAGSYPDHLGSCVISYIQSRGEDGKVSGHFKAALMDHIGGESYKLTDGFFRIPVPDHPVGGGTEASSP